MKYRNPEWHIFPDGKWHHVVTVSDNKSIRTFIDGKLVGEKDISKW